MWHEKFEHIGKKLFLRGCNNSHSGNISVREGNRIFISRTGSMLDEITEQDIIEVGLLPDEIKDKQASMELLNHRALYLANENINAIVHAHAPYAIVMADGQQAIKPYDQEGGYYFERIPVINAQNTIASTEVAEKIKQYANTSHAVVIQKHGVFSWGKNLEEAYHFLTVVESASRVNYLLEVKNAPKNDSN
ncbi:MAG: class II aldolase/adducin family protein [Gammaproteobacteria bacterium]|jgi:L-fuculose-phosphate aldolase